MNVTDEVGKKEECFGHVVCTHQNPTPLQTSISNFQNARNSRDSQKSGKQWLIVHMNDDRPGVCDTRNEATMIL